MDGIDSVAKKTLQERKSSTGLKSEPAKSPPQKAAAPAKNATDMSKSRSTQRTIASENPFAKLERDLPKGGKAMRIAATEGAEEVGEKVAKKGLGKMAKKAAIAAGIAGPVGLGLGLLQEGLEAEDAGSEEEKLDEVAMGQYAKTEAKLKADKKISSLKASTKKQYDKPTRKKPVADNMKKSYPAIVNPEVTQEDYEGELARQYGPLDAGDDAQTDRDDYGFNKVVKKVMGDEMRKAAKRVNKR